MSNKINRLLRRAKRCQNFLADAKLYHQELNEIVDELRALKFKGNARATLRDNFKDKNVAFRTTSVKRFELEFL